MVVTLAQLTHHPSAVIKGELPAMLDDMHTRFGVCGEFIVPPGTFALHAGDTRIDRVLTASGTLEVGDLRRSFGGSTKDLTAASLRGLHCTKTSLPARLYYRVAHHCPAY